VRARGATHAQLALHAPLTFRVTSPAEVEPTAEQASTSEFHSRTEFMFNSATWPREKARLPGRAQQASFLRRTVRLEHGATSHFRVAEAGTDAALVAQMEADFSQLAHDFGATRSTLRLPEVDPRPRMAVLVSQVDHCLQELLHRWEGARGAWSCQRLVAHAACHASSRSALHARS
jgi:hypothetical protein